MDFKEAYHDTCSTVAIAARSGNLQMVKKLIKKGKSTDVKDNRGWIALHEAAYNGHSRCLQELLQQNMRLSHQSQKAFENSAGRVQIACNKLPALFSTLSCLQHSDIEVDMRTFEVETALILASRRGQVKCVRYLLKAGADANAQTNEGFSPLWEACQSGSLECVQLLLNAHAHVNHQMYTDDTPLHVIIQMHGDVDIVLSLLEARADIRMKTENGHTPLFVAAQFGRQECLKILIEHSKSKGLKFLKQYVNTPASDNASPLYIAAQENNAECCDLLLKYGADPHHHISLSPSIKSYPLQIAIFKNNLRCMDILIKGTDRVKFQFTEKHIKTFEDKYKNMFECWKFHPLILAMEHNDGKCFNCLLRNGYGDLFQSPFTPDLFQYALRLRPVVILVKHYETWLRERFASAQFDIYKAIIYHYYWTEKMLDIHIFVVLLRLGIITSKYLHCKQVQSCRTFYNDGSYLHLLALYKYFSNDHICKPCKRANRSSCIEQLHILGWSPVGVLTRMCLVPNLWRCNVDDWVEYICGEHDVGIGMKYDSDDDSDEAQTNEITVISKMYHIEAACSNLQHMCRATVVYRLMGNNNYSREAISSLAVPKMLQNYLMYSEYGSVSRSLLRGFQKLRLVEKTIDKVFEETENVQ